MTVSQRDFTTALLNPDIATPEGLVDPKGRPAGKRFNVYRNNVIVSLMDAMETAFPVIAQLIGPQNFRNLARIFVQAHPPDSPMLMFYGGAFPAFLERFEPLAHLHYLPDVARLELACRDAYHAVDVADIAPDALAEVSPDKLMDVRLGLSPAMQIVSSPYPIVSIWHFNQTDGAPKPAAIAETALVARPELDLVMSVIRPDQAAFLTKLKADAPLGEAYEAGLETDDAFDLSAALGLALSQRIITTIKS